MSRTIPDITPADVDRLARIDKMLRLWGIRHFRAAELVRLRSDWDGPSYAIPPEPLWPNVGSALCIADAARHAYGGPVEVWSGYRPPEYNAHVGGEADSQHLHFRALDLAPADGDIERFAPVLYAATEAASMLGGWTGFGWYDTFCHVDYGARQYKRRRRWDKRT